MIKVSCSLLAITVAGRFIAESFLLHFEIEFMGQQSYVVIEGKNFRSFFNFFVIQVATLVVVSFQSQELQALQQVFSHLQAFYRQQNQNHYYQLQSLPSFRHGHKSAELFVPLSKPILILIQYANPKPQTQLVFFRLLEFKELVAL